MIKNKFMEFDSIAKIEYIVFGQCPNYCSFCYQKMFTDIQDPKLMTYDSIVSRYLQVEKYLDSKVLPPHVEIILIGGELFCWENQEIVNAFKKIADITVEWEKKYNKKFHIVLVTNLIYKNLDNLLETFNYIKSKGLVNNAPIITSFDFKARFNTEEMWEMFKKNVLTILNLQEYKEFSLAFDIIRTKGFLDAMRGIDNLEKIEFFDKHIYNNNRCLLSMDNLSYLISQKESVKDLILDFDESIECYKLMYEKYNNLFMLIHNFKGEQKRTCFNRIKAILDLKIHDDPCFYDHFGNTKNSKELFHCISENKKDIIEGVLSYYNCEYCDFYTQCNLECPAMRNNRTAYKKCDIKEVFKWIRDNNE